MFVKDNEIITRKRFKCRLFSSKRILGETIDSDCDKAEKFVFHKNKKYQLETVYEETMDAVYVETN